MICVVLVILWKSTITWKEGGLAYCIPDWPLVKRIPLLYLSATADTMKAA